jgi:hypothetical protein
MVSNGEDGGVPRYVRRQGAGALSSPASAIPQWIAPTLHRTAGRDPLALQTITQDRIIPVLLPGILALSRRARYFSFHCFLLGEYRRRRMPATNAALSKFMLAREYELALAVELCVRACGSSPVGRDRSRPATSPIRDAYDRGESVESVLGGYGLYYRSPLADLGLVARAGTLLGEDPMPIDVIVSGSKGPALAEEFRSAVSQTEYFRKHFTGLGPIPHDVLVEYGSVACLCRLDDFVGERDLIREALFVPRAEGMEADALQRRRSFALLLGASSRNPACATDPAAFRERVWEDFLDRDGLGEARSRVTSQWTALILKEYMQDSLSAMWIDLCRTGLKSQPDDGFRPESLTDLLRTSLASERSLEVAGEAIAVGPNTPMTELHERFAATTSGMSLEELRKWAREQESVVAGVLFLMTVCERLPPRALFSESDRAFLDVGVQRSMRQYGLLQTAHALEMHMSEAPTLADTVEWAVRRLLIDVHERVAYSKLPNFTFRFRWESGRLRFYDLGVWPFDLADMRHGSMSQLSLDLGYWEKGPSDGGLLTADGESFVTEAFG